MRRPALGATCKAAAPRQQRCRFMCAPRSAQAHLSRVHATVGYGGDDSQSLDSERSDLVNNETVLFIFQLELDMQLQRQLNYEAYEAAQAVRLKREQIDKALRQVQEQKASSAGTEAGAASLSVSDFNSEGLRVRTEMQRAVEEERYADAAKYRDMLAELERASKRAQALADEFGAGAPVLRLGQRVLHATHGYRGVVVGWDRQCCETEEWLERSGAQDLRRGTRQTFYHLLVDVRDWDVDDDLQPPVAYVAEELLTCPELEDGRSWREVYGLEDELAHPYSYILFLGRDARGDLIPCRQLRDKYNVPRRDVRSPVPGGGKDDDEEEGPSGKPDAPGGGGGGPTKVPDSDMGSLQ